MEMLYFFFISKNFLAFQGLLPFKNDKVLNSFGFIYVDVSFVLQYDFALEHSVLQKMGEWRKGRKAAVENRRERIKTQEGATCEPQDTGVIT